jgi:hypothetical protein
LNPIKRREFIRKLRKLGFDGPYSGTRHQFMTLNKQRQTLPSNSEYSGPQVRILLRQVEQIVGRGISREEWTSL